MAICSGQVTAQFTCGLDAWSGDLQANSECGYMWHWMAFLRPGINKQHKTHSNKNASSQIWQKADTCDNRVTIEIGQISNFNE